MFSKIFFKFSLICVSAIAAVLLIISVIIPVSDTYFYFNRMKSELYTVSESNFGDNLNNIILSQDDIDEKEKNISNLISDYSGQLALNENRKLYIFDKDYN